MFASELNAKCEKFVSWHPTKSAYQIDAFTISWRNLRFYAFPPFSQILRMLTKIKREKAEGIIVVPRWGNQPWYPLLQRIIVGEPIIFEPNKELLISVDRKTTHPRAEHLSLMAAKVSAKLS